MGHDQEEKDGQPIVELADGVAWECWLDERFDSPTGVWLKIAKKGSGRTTVSHAEALEVAICYGWIDGQRFPYDETYFLQRFVRRRPQSRWSQVNREKAERLIADGKMRPPGLEQVETAKADGRWEAAYPAQSRAPVPDDLQAALEQHPDAKKFFETLKGTRRYAFLYRLHNVRKPESRAKRIAGYIELLSEGKTLTD